MVVLCAGCELPIMDRFLLNVLDRVWHIGCVQCSECKSCLSERCFSRDGKLYCRQDFFRRYGARCGGCEKEILPNELVRRAQSQVYHLKCFSCMVCHKQLSTGEELYMIDDNRFICKDDYLTKFQGSDFDDADLDQSLLDTGCDDTFSDKDGGGCTSDHDDDDDDVMSHDSANCGSGSHRTLVITPGNGFVGHNHHHHLSHRQQFGSNRVKAECTTRAGGVPSPGGGVGPSSPVSGSCCAVGVKSERLSNDATSNDSNCSNEKMNGSMKDKENNNTPGKDSGSGGGAPGGVESASVAGKRRGPRTTIKAKQLETLKAAFAATPKPTRHIREQLAQETGLNMRVIQVWFQNRRSKERRMKQLSALGVRRQFYRNPRRLRALRPGEDLVDGSDLLGQPGFSYFVDGSDFYSGYPPYGDYFSTHHPGADPSMTYMGPPPTPGQQTAMMDHASGQNFHETAYLTPADLAMRQSSTPDSSPMSAMLRDVANANGAHFGPPGGPHHGLPPPGLHASTFGRHPGLRHPPPSVSVSASVPLSASSSQPPPSAIAQSHIEIPVEIW